MRARIKSVAAGCRTAGKKKKKNVFTPKFYRELYLTLCSRARPKAAAAGIRGRNFKGTRGFVVESVWVSPLERTVSAPSRDPLCKSGGQRCASKSRWRGIKSY